MESVIKAFEHYHKIVRAMVRCQSLNFSSYLAILRRKVLLRHLCNFNSYIALTAYYYVMYMYPKLFNGPPLMKGIVTEFPILLCYKHYNKYPRRHTICCYFFLLSCQRVTASHLNTISPSSLAIHPLNFR